MDLPCGYTPRCLSLAGQGVSFIGCDLEAAVNEVAPLIDSIAAPEQKPYIHYAAVDATNYDSLRNAVKDAEGPLFITTEGMMPYFTDFEMDTLCGNIARLLQQHGGCWVSMDPNNAAMFMSPMKILMGEAALMAMAKKNQETYASTADVKIDTCFYKGHNPEAKAKAVAILAKNGLQLEELPIADYLPELASYASVKSEQVAAFKGAMSRITIWRMTLAENSVVPDKKQGESFDFAATMQGNELRLFLAGRLDTISAPEVLSVFDKIEAEQTVSAVSVDCGKLDYISAAGLRVLLIMAKKHPGALSLSQVNKTVIEILEQSGFIDLLEIKV